MCQDLTRMPFSSVPNKVPNSLRSLMTLTFKNVPMYIGIWSPEATQGFSVLRCGLRTNLPPFIRLLILAFPYCHKETKKMTLFKKYGLF